MKKLPLTLACWDYDRTRALADGRVAVDGIDLNYIPLPVEETFFRMLRFREFDAAELSLSSYSVSLLRDDPAFIAVPVFPRGSFAIPAFSFPPQVALPPRPSLSENASACRNIR